MLETVTRRATESPGMERKLSAILAADVVGYSRLMGEDEAGTLTALKSHRAELIDPKRDSWYKNLLLRAGLPE